jgi:hypothetical protein
MTAQPSPLAAILDQLAAHAEHLTQLAARLDALDDAGNDADAYPAARPPGPSRRWWQLAGDDRDRAITALHGWVEQVYRPGYGQIAALLGPCWDEHPLCLYGIDILAELWSVLYLTTRTPAILSAQAEYQARILPALADQMTTETRTCPHARARTTRNTP